MNVEALQQVNAFLASPLASPVRTLLNAADGPGFRLWVQDTFADGWVQLHGPRTVGDICRAMLRQKLYYLEQLRISNIQEGV